MAIDWEVADFISFSMMGDRYLRECTGGKYGKEVHHDATFV
jgi:hypothetical protein